jgi:predicted secreted protein
MIVKGTDAVVFFYNEALAQWITYGCARTCTININTDFLETSIIGTGTAKTFIPTSYSFEGDIEGLVNLEKTDNPLTIASLIYYQLNGIKLLMQFNYEDQNNNFMTLQADFYVQNSSVISSFDNIATFNVGFKGTGALTLIEGS